MTETSSDSPASLEIRRYAPEGFDEIDWQMEDIHADHSLSTFYKNRGYELSGSDDEGYTIIKSLQDK